MAADLFPRLAVTLGDPAGIGPELAVRLLAEPTVLDSASVSLLADATEVEDAAALAGVTVPIGSEPGKVVLLDDGSAPDEPIPLREPSKRAGERALHQLRRALALAKDGEIDAILFTPLNKTSLHLAGMHEDDELRWFAKQLDFEGTTSELNVLPELWTARVTSHIPMKDVAARITSDAVTAVIELLHSVLADSGTEHPRLAVCAYNPHAGENGIFGREEIDDIGPGVAAAQAHGIDVKGPFPADTLFLAAKRGDYDGVVTMYHDQGQIAMKMMGFDKGVTLQGGLPVAIVTPAHGTSFDLVGTNTADLGAIRCAYDLAVTIGARLRNSR